VSATVESPKGTCILYRAYWYDCEPFTGRVKNPNSGQIENYQQSDHAQKSRALVEGVDLVVSGRNRRRAGGDRDAVTSSVVGEVLLLEDRAAQIPANGVGQLLDLVAAAGPSAGLTALLHPQGVDGRSGL
jgi:hypothetical protein